ncbi:putative bifunctional diguanylate cyclase/phosphodiesterase [Marinobacter sp. V034]|uniref:putative bifunctional diguanylate cyclase/phosphodiesterase n=1 Tax=Marinobacter sp. V034 TaxID=3459610 RepID=UPI004043ACA7
MENRNLFAFELDDRSSKHKTPPPDIQLHWKVLSVDDNPHYQQSLAFALNNVRILGRPVTLITTDSATKASRIMRDTPDIAVALLDVVMETDDAGLRLVNTIRETLDNQLTRIVLVTGQPGMAPRLDVMEAFDIDDYWNKTELTHDHLISMLSGNLRSWRKAAELEEARSGLEQLVNACQAITYKRYLTELTRTALQHLGSLAGTTDGIVCLHRSKLSNLDGAVIIAASGSLQPTMGQTLAEAEPLLPLPLIARAAEQKSHISDQSYHLFYFANPDINDVEYFIVLERARTDAKQTDWNLLSVFTEQVATGFANVSLLNRLSETAYTDLALGCANRSKLLVELKRYTLRPDIRCRLLITTLVQLQDIIFSLGEDFLNQLLRGMLDRLKEQFPGSFIARHERGGFAMLLTGSEDLSQPSLHAMFDNPLTIDSGQHTVLASFAVVTLGAASNLQPTQLLSLAEGHLNHAFHTGKFFIEYKPELQEQITQSYQLLNELRVALNEQQLFILLQPKVRLRDTRIVGFEALVRWQHPDGRIILPADFIHVAETSGLIETLGRQVLHATCVAAKALENAGFRLPVSFNASGTELAKPGYFDQVLSIIALHNLSPSQLDLEITETQAMQEFSDIRRGLLNLIDKGSKVSIDDFGTGYSSLEYVTRLAATTLKIDRSFISGMNEPRGEEVVELILRLSRRFELEVVAEGIETKAQMESLQAKGCETGQGYYFARPMPVAEAIEWAANNLSS